MRYHNPIIPGFHPDPSVCRVGEDYYLVTSSFEYFPGVPIFHSQDLVNWRQIGHCLTRASQLPLAGVPGSRAGIYAPTIRHHDGLFYMVTTNVSGGGHFYVTAADPAGEWSEPVWLDLGPELVGSIDPSFLFDAGKVYLTCTGPGQRIFQCELDLSTGKPLTTPRPISSGMGGKYPEGPHLYPINGQYYLMLAEGGTEYGHYEIIYRSPTPWGPFEACPHNPILTHRGTELPIQALGHADLVQAQDESWWLVCLGIRPYGYPPCHHLGRETFLAPVTWTADGWPVIGDQGRLALDMEAHTLPPQPFSVPVTRDDFATPALGLVWNYLRNPDLADYSLTERSGWLWLRGSARTLDEAASPTFVGRRQEHFRCRATTLVDFTPQAETDEAGLTVLMNEHHHYEIALCGSKIILRRRIGSLSAVTAEVPFRGGPVQLRIEADAAWYHFSYAYPGAAFQPLGTGETRYLSTEVGGAFTGVYLGLYAISQQQTAAAFDGFDYEPLPEA